ncbi:MAG TPA: alkaline phosphatase family protein [Candidatus Sulfotelmatobacter sp.]|jgi:phospholipase C
MKFPMRACLLLCVITTLQAYGQISSFEHIVIIIQENRTPDNMFQGLCSSPFGKSTSCSINPSATQYDIQTSNWLDKTATGGVRQPASIALANTYDVSHSHDGFSTTCDLNKTTGVCRMDGAASTTCTGTCATNPHYKYVDNSKSILNPYLTMATSYGFANYMFQTNQGPTFPAHQFLFGGTSAPSAADDAAGTFAGDNVFPQVGNTIAGCIALSTSHVTLVQANGKSSQIYPCFEHQTLADLLVSAGLTWKYYTPGAGSIVTAPNAIDHICEPSEPAGGNCTGSEWNSSVVVNPAKVLTDITNCKLASVTWVTPSGKNSDHANSNTGGGPAWVASIVNGIGNNKKCKDGETYWDNTAVLITWDDWGGWYDHEPPTFLSGVEGDYQYGFRVPFLFVSAYTPAATISNERMDFGSVLRFVEHNFGMAEGALNFADARASTDLGEFYNLKLVARPFQTVPARLDADYFLNDKSPLTDPDDY